MRLFGITRTWLWGNVSLRSLKTIGRGDSNESVQRIKIRITNGNHIMGCYLYWF